MPWGGPITINVEALAVKAVVSQLRDTICHIAQLMVNCHSVEPGS